MNKVVIIFVIITLISCNNDYEYCKEHNEIDIKWIDEIYNSAPEKNLIPLSNLDGIIQYHGSDSWGWFNHTIRVIERDENRIIQLNDYRRTNKKNYNKTIYKENILTDKQNESLNKKISLLFCKPVNIETVTGVDGNSFNLIVKKDNKLQAFKWQSIFKNKDPGEFKILTTEVTELVGELMSLSKFPNGSKHLLFSTNKNSIDSIDIEIFLANQFNQRASNVYFDDTVVSQDQDGIAKLTIHRLDTMRIKKRIKIKVELLNGKIIEM